jgi:hypothetical protein
MHEAYRAELQTGAAKYEAFANEHGMKLSPHA